MTDDSLAFDEKLELRSWGLPDYILQKYLKKGVARMFPWQVECLMSENVLLGGNLIYSAPTSAGKTLVSEMLALKTVLERKKKVIVILPFVSVVREKMIYFQDVLCGSGIRVEGFMGSYNPPGGFKNVHLAVCTIEKANNLINRMLEEKNFEDIGCIVVDELHLLGDPHRGYLLELLLTKIKYVCQKGLAQGIQIVGMSATLPNLDLLAKWLNATLYHTEFRPIPLFEYLKVGRTIYKSPELVESFELQTAVEIPNDPGDVVALCLDTIIQGFSVLVFCPSKNWCETLAVQISTEIRRIGNEKGSISQSLRSQLNSTGISDTLEQLKKCPAGLERNLGKSVSFGVGYHHAGLTLDERDIIEGGFRQSIIRVLVATSTLSSGVNLPARRVIIRSPAFQGQCMDILTYKQMIGRAGRMGKDTAGESFLVCTEKDINWGKQLVTSHLPPVESCLGYGDLSSSLKRALLEVIAGGVVTDRDDVMDYVMCTLLAASVDNERISSAVLSCTKYLEENEFIKVDSTGGVIPSPLAEACLSSSVPPDTALYLLKELHKARQCFVLDSDLHAIYQVTPYSICDSWAVDWMKVFAVWEEIPPNMQKIGDLVGVEDRFLIRAMRGTINLNADEYAQKISIHKRFYTSLALQDLINEMPLNDVTTKYGCTKGMLQSLQQSASTFAAMVTSFCRKLGWGGLEVLLSELATRIQFGVQKELLDLLRLDCMTSTMARSLFNSEIETLSILASSNVQAVQLAVNKTKPFKSDLIEADSQGNKNVYLPGRPGLSEREAADILIFEARRFLLKEMGVKTAEWEDTKINLVNGTIYEQSTLIPDKPYPSADNDLPLNPESNIGTKLSGVKKNDGKKEDIIEEDNHESATEKSPHVEFDLELPGQNDDQFPDTVIINDNDSKLDCSDINRTDNPEEIAEVYVPESQDKRSTENSISVENNFCNLREKGERIKNQSLIDCVSVKLENGEKNLETANKTIRNKPSTSITSSDSVTFPAFEANAKLCSTYILDEKMTVDKFSVEALCGSPNISDFDFMDSILDQISSNHNSPANRKITFSTPVLKHGNEDCNNSSNDLFSESPALKTPEKTIIQNHNSLEEFDSNWGGDSLLELSQTFDNKLTELCSTKLKITPCIKRKAGEITGGNIPKKKKICLSNKKSAMKDIRNSVENKKHQQSMNQMVSSMKNDFTNPTSIHNDLGHSFGDTLEFDTQLENIITTSTSIKSPKFAVPQQKLLQKESPFEKSHLKLITRPKSEGDIKVNNCKNALADTVIANAFDVSFKLSQMIQDADTEDVHISDSEDLINSSPDISHKTKTELSGCHNSKSGRTIFRSLSLINSPIKSISSPKSSPRHYASPSKYPSILTDIVKHHKSPNNQKGLPFSCKSPGRSPQRNNKTVSDNSLLFKNDVLLFLKTPENSPNKKEFITSQQQGVILSPTNGLAEHLKTTPVKCKVDNALLMSGKSPQIDCKVSKTAAQKINVIPSSENSPRRFKNNTISQKVPTVILSPQIIDDSPEITKKKTVASVSINSSQNKNSNSNIDNKKLVPSNSQLSNCKNNEVQDPPRDKLPTPSKLLKLDHLHKNSRMLDVVAVGENNSMIESIYKLKEFVFKIKTKKLNDIETQQSKIGGKIVRKIVKNEDTVEPQFKVDDEAIIGLYLYGGTITYYFNMMTLGPSHYRILKCLFSQNSIKLYGINMNYQLKLFYKCCGYVISCKIFDLLIADWLLNPTENIKTLGELASCYLKHNQRSPVKSEYDILSEVSLIWSLQSELSIQLQKANLLNHFEEIDMPIQSKVLFIELTGIGFKQDVANELWSSSTELMGKLEMEAFSYANHKFSLGSNSELSKVKKELKISPEEEANHPLVITVQNWRKLHSLKTRNLSQLLFKKESRCHCKNSTLTVTGRIMHHNPDLQHIPRDFTVNEQLFSLRSAFVAGSGNILVSADYSQLELRILAHFSQDPILVPLLRKGDDVFKNIAAEWNGITPDKVSDELRHQVKQLAYGIIYGMGEKALGEALGKTTTDASLLSARFKRSFPKLEEFVEQTIKECSQSGEIKTLTGRVRRIPGINSPNIHVKAQAERQAVNSKIQGSASDIAKKAMVTVENNLHKKFPARSNLPTLFHSSHLVLQLHDEFIYEVGENILDDFVSILRDTMETATFLSVPLPVVVKAGKSWGQLKRL